MPATYSLVNIARAYCSMMNLVFIGGVGVGAFKETFHVTSATGEALALKLYRSGFSAERTTREIEAMRRCSHHNIAQLISIEDFAWEGSIYSVILEEYMEGGTLADRLKDHGQLTVTQSRELARPLIDALGHIASLALVHRDIKPDNILFRKDQTTPVIVDFGLVRDLRSVSLTQSWVTRGPGTPLFAAPEQLRNEKSLIDWRSDQFSLGVTLSYAAFDMHPYEHPGDKLHNIVERVADRGAMSPAFAEKARLSALEVLTKMAAPWPVQRIRTPSLLADLWSQD